MSTEKPSIPTTNDLVRMVVSGISLDPFSSLPFVILKDEEGKLAIPIFIGMLEAGAIAAEIEHIEVSRPLTHDLMRRICEDFGISVVRAVITQLIENTYFAQLYTKREGSEHAFDCRPSDALSLALRTGAPIFVARDVIEKTRTIDLSAKIAEETQKSGQEKTDWAKLLEHMSEKDFGKYRM